ncbi:MAG: hypothetical protein LW832_09465 [Parachlamydia sp.]|jgi:protein-disulfide isomerase|nr:hypothetical protein [Parachlamydia sp.]
MANFRNIFTVLLIFCCIPLLYAAKAKKEAIDIGLGNPQSPLKFYVISDWFCQSCKKAEPQIEEVYEAFRTRAGFYFIDYALHQETANYSPYHLSFLLNEKEDYLKARRALNELSESKQSPTEQDIVRLAKENHLYYKPLPYEQVKKGSDFFEKIRKQYKVSRTPTLVVVDTASGHYEELAGSEISVANVSQALQQMMEKGKKKKAWYKFW